MGSGRYSSQGSKYHRIAYITKDTYQISWVVDRYYSGSRLRFPTLYTRITDEKGAIRFAKKHGLKLNDKTT